MLIKIIKRLKWHNSKTHHLAYHLLGLFVLFSARQPERPTVQIPVYDWVTIACKLVQNSVVFWTIPVQPAKNIIFHRWKVKVLNYEIRIRPVHHAAVTEFPYCINEWLECPDLRKIISIMPFIVDCYNGFFRFTIIIFVTKRYALYKTAWIIDGAVNVNIIRRRYSRFPYLI